MAYAPYVSTADNWLERVLITAALSTYLLSILMGTGSVYFKSGGVDTVIQVIYYFCMILIILMLCRFVLNVLRQLCLKKKWLIRQHQQRQGALGARVPLLAHRD